MIGDWPPSFAEALEEIASNHPSSAVRRASALASGAPAERKLGSTAVILPCAVTRSRLAMMTRPVTNLGYQAFSKEMESRHSSMMGEWLRGFPIGVVLVVVLLSAAVGACDRSGRQETAPERTEFTGTEFVPLASFYEVAAEVGTRYLPPPGGTHRVDLIELQNMDRATLEFQVAFRSACQWHRYWLDRWAVGGGAGADQALLVIMSIPSWAPFEGMEEFWKQFHSDLDVGATDGPQWFVDVNCLNVRDELVAPRDMSAQDRSLAVILEEETAALLSVEERAELIDRLARQLPVPDGGFLGSPETYSHIQTEMELAAVMTHHAWCDWLGAFIDAADANDWPTAGDMVEGLSRFTAHKNLSAVDRFGIERQVREKVEEGARQRNPLWPVAEYRSNCFGLSILRDQRLQDWALGDDDPAPNVSP